MAIFAGFYLMRNDIRSLDLNLLKALDALLDERSVTRAALHLSLTQPAVSGMLTRLRDFFDDPLFVRTSHGMVPTPRAIDLANPVKRVLVDINAILRPLDFEPMLAEHTYTLVATDYAVNAVITPLMALLKQRAPGIKIAIRAIESERVYQQLARGDVDIALLTPETTPDDLHCGVLYEESYVLVVGKQHPLADSGEVTLQQFCAQEHILVSSAGKFSGVTDEVLSVLGVSRCVGMSVNSFLVIPDILQVTNMAAVIPPRMVAHSDKVVRLPLPVSILGFTKSMAWHERTHRDPAHRWLRVLLSEVSHSPDIN
ncbi:MAG: PCP degradation transcriptional activation protein [Candidatus Erwinia impunctatus]|nr:PCP degradation transcriptional activation protein [Culicoides impunctatus]